MAVVLADVMSPKGRIELGLFGEDQPTTEARVTAYLVEADAKVAVDVVERDEAIKAWTYYRSFDAAALLMDSRSASSSLAEVGSRTMIGEQMRAMRDRAAEWLSTFRTLTATAVVTPGPKEGTGTGSVPTEVRF